MGSFNVTCSVSGISIDDGDPVAYFPLKKAEYIEPKSRFLIYANCLYEPVCLPIFGEYDDYGRVFIARDTNVEIVEKHFGKPIDSIVNDEDENGNQCMPEPIEGGMFVHREIYNHLVVNQLDFWGKKPDGKSLEQTFDESSKSITTAKLEAKETIKWKNEYAKKMGKPYPESAEELRTQYTGLMWTLACGAPTIFTYGNDYQDFRDLYYDSIEKGELKKELCDFWKFHMAMFSSNKHYTPVMNGEQCGNPRQSKILAEKTLEILNKKIEEIASW